MQGCTGSGGFNREDPWASLSSQERTMSVCPSGLVPPKIKSIVTALRCPLRVPERRWCRTRPNYADSESNFADMRPTGRIQPAPRQIRHGAVSEFDHFWPDFANIGGVVNRSVSIEFQVALPFYQGFAQNCLAVLFKFLMPTAKMMMKPR